MHWLGKGDLSRLPPEVRSLIEKAVYSAYTLRGYPGTYAIVTDKREIFIVNSDGELIASPQFSTLDELPIGDVAGWRPDDRINSSLAAALPLALLRTT